MTQIINLIRRNKACNGTDSQLAKNIKEHLIKVIEQTESDCEYTSTQYLANQLIKKVEKM